MNSPPTIKQRVLTMLEQLPDDVDFERTIVAIDALRRIEIGLRESQQGQGMEHEAFMRELIASNEEAPCVVDATSDAGPAEHP